MATKKKTLHNKSCKCKHKKVIRFGKYYLQGNESMECIIKMIQAGVNVYHQPLVDGKAIYYSGDTDKKTKAWIESMIEKGYRAFITYGIPENGCGLPKHPPCP